jgi:hypothetical protein
MKKKTTPPDSLSDSFKLDEIEPLIFFAKRERDEKWIELLSHDAGDDTDSKSSSREKKNQK